MECLPEQKQSSWAGRTLGHYRSHPEQSQRERQGRTAGGSQSRLPLGYVSRRSPVRNLGTV